MLLVMVHLRCVDAIATGGLHHHRERSCAGLGHHCALAATVPTDPAFIDGAREALFEAVASACVVVSSRCEGCASCVSLSCDSTSLCNTHKGRRAAHERSTRPMTTKSSHYLGQTPYIIANAWSAHPSQPAQRQRSRGCGGRSRGRASRRRRAWGAHQSRKLRLASPCPRRRACCRIARAG